MKEVQSTVYVAYDGTKHLTEEACLAHEKYQREQDLCNKYEIDYCKFNNAGLFGDIAYESEEGVVSVVLYNRLIDRIEYIANKSIDVETEAHTAIKLLTKFAREGIADNL